MLVYRSPEDKKAVDNLVENFQAPYSNSAAPSPKGTHARILVFNSLKKSELKNPVHTSHELILAD